MIVILYVLNPGLRESVAVYRHRRGISVESKLQAQLLDGSRRAGGAASGRALKRVLLDGAGPAYET